MRHLKITAVALITAAVALAVLNAWRSDSGNVPEAPAPGRKLARSLKTQSKREGEVTVSVAPTKTDDGWDFDIMLDTHSVELDQDLVAHTVLRDASGREHRPETWAGDLPGGHHRKGTLKFSRESIESDPLILVMRNVGGVSERVFHWELAEYR